MPQKTNEAQDRAPQQAACRRPPEHAGGGRARDGDRRRSSPRARTSPRAASTAPRRTTWRRSRRSRSPSCCRRLPGGRGRAGAASSARASSCAASPPATRTRAPGLRAGLHVLGLDAAPSRRARGVRDAGATSQALRAAARRRPAPRAKRDARAAPPARRTPRDPHAGRPPPRRGEGPRARGGRQDAARRARCVESPRARLARAAGPAARRAASGPRATSRSPIAPTCFAGLAEGETPGRERRIPGADCARDAARALRRSASGRTREDGERGSGRAGHARASPTTCSTAATRAPRCGCSPGVLAAQPFLSRARRRRVAAAAVRSRA